MFIFEKPLKLFCHNDEKLLCCVCQHQGHCVCPMEEAALDLKGFRRHMYTIPRKGKISGDPEAGFWTITLSNGCYTAMTSPSSQLDLTGHLEKVRVNLDYEAGEVSFSNPLDLTSIYTFTGHFTERMFPFFCPGANINGSNPGPLKISPVKVAVWNSASW